jgi:hypothetical protein
MPPVSFQVAEIGGHLVPCLTSLVHLSSERIFVSGLRERHDAAKRRHLKRGATVREQPALIG